MPMMKVRGLGDGNPTSSPGGTTTAAAFDVTALPGQIFAGAQKWMSPSDAFSTLTTDISNPMANLGTIIGIAIVPLAGLMLLKGMGGHHRR